MEEAMVRSLRLLEVDIAFGSFWLWNLGGFSAFYGRCCAWGCVSVMLADVVFLTDLRFCPDRVELNQVWIKWISDFRINSRFALRYSRRRRILPGPKTALGCPIRFSSGLRLIVVAALQSLEEIRPFSRKWQIPSLFIYLRIFGEISI